MHPLAFLRHLGILYPKVLFLGSSAVSVSRISACDRHILTVTKVVLYMGSEAPKCLKNHIRDNPEIKADAGPLILWSAGHLSVLKWKQ